MVRLENLKMKWMWTKIIYERKKCEFFKSIIRKEHEIEEIILTRLTKPALTITEIPISILLRFGLMLKKGIFIKLIYGGFKYPDLSIYLILARKIYHRN